jgi:SAM-dependent methyltransferase
MKFVPVEYEDLAFEYYDSDRHPTCANFRLASLHLISQYLSISQLEGSPLVLEVGAGRSVFVDLGHRFPNYMQHAIITDRSESMLQYSDRLSHQVPIVLADAENLPFADSSFDVVISSLGDPYNTERFWRQIGRVLTPNGRCIFTAPASKWADRFRREAQFGQQTLAVFETKSGRAVAVESIVKNTTDQIDLVERVGLVVTDFLTYTRDMFPKRAHLSPKISKFTDATSSVVCLFAVRRSARGN